MTAGDRIGFFLRAADRWGRRALAGQGTLLPANGFITSFFGCKRREAAHSWRFPQHAQRGRHACKVQADGMQATTQAGGRSTEPCNASGRASASRRCGPPRRAPSAQRGDCDRSRPAREARRFGVPTRHRAAKMNPAGTPHHRPVTRPRIGGCASHAGEGRHLEGSAGRIAAQNRIAIEDARPTGRRKCASPAPRFGPLPRQQTRVLQCSIE